MLWNGAGWDPISPGPENLPDHLAVLGDSLFAAGYYGYLDGGLTPAGYYVTRWTGTRWQRLGREWRGDPGIPVGHDGALYLARRSTLYRWTGQEWIVASRPQNRRPRRALLGWRRPLCRRRQVRGRSRNRTRPRPLGRHRLAGRGRSDGSRPQPLAGRAAGDPRRRRRWIQRRRDILAGRRSPGVRPGPVGRVVLAVAATRPRPVSCERVLRSRWASHGGLR